MKSGIINGPEMPKHLQTFFLLSSAAVLTSCSHDSATSPEPQPQPAPQQPQTPVATISSVVVTASAHTTIVGSTANMAAAVAADPGVQYTVSWSLSGATNTATIDAATGVLTAVAPGYAYPRACATATLSNGQTRRVCDEASIRIVTSFSSVQNGSFAFVRNGTILLSGSDDSEPVPLITGAARPSWSPDGARIAFTRPANNLVGWQLCIGRQDGSDIRCATGADNGIVLGKPSWSPDGSMIAFSTFTYSCPNGQCGQLGGYFSGLLLLNTATMQVQALNTPAVTSAAWSPDGRKIAITIFGAGTFGRGALATVNPDGSGLNIFAPSLASYSVNEVTWSPDGSKLALTLSDENACPWYCDTAIGIVSVDAMILKVLDRAYTCFGSPCVGDDAYIVGAPQWVDNGTRVAYTIRGGDCDERVSCASDIAIAGVDDGSIGVLVTSAGFPSWRQ